MAKIKGTSAIKEGGSFTLSQWRTWSPDERWELIGGIAYNMSPAPRYSHQQIAGALYADLRIFLSGNSCIPSIAPLDVFLPEGVPDSRDTVVQPDVLVICDKGKIAEDGIHGAPDFIAEILSERTAFKDLNEKRAIYERSGVREYWIVNPGNGSVFQYILSKGRYGPAVEILKESPIKNTVFPGFSWKVPDTDID